ncbi:NADH:flavin oxidoreductase/NADH oxidase [Pseudomonas citronellolis]|jgi:2,4-dienoyl-CoA reductase-like NADH-dependent reductase (Old Yellow Enzyme family)|uniref:NADH:flavin oxidoreductase/NADH oxidase n=1 Tax=Pseudomonas citronellolis TaxID=53408 RepID=UPI00248E48C8|nr:NADH:flavin oxidoreductase/NADH oxidase [Pseudomonas citronellolis]
MAALFSSFRLKDTELRNRIAVAPMCQYSAVDGFTNDWHQAHYRSLARGGAGLVVVEATAVSPEGRITPACTGIWSDEHIGGLAAIAAGIRNAGAVPGIQIGHAGRKASANTPWTGDDHIQEEDPRGWLPISPSAIAYGAELPRTPLEMSEIEIVRVRSQFAEAARRAYEAGFEWLELHFAHGYLGQSFFSRHSNQRSDRYGGSLENRSRFLLETLASVREVWPERLPLTARFGVIEYDGQDEETLDESIGLIRRMRGEGLDLIDVSIGFSTPQADIPWAEALLLPIAERVRRETAMPVASSWGIDDPHVADQAVSQQKLDIVMMGHAFLANPHYPYELALALKVDINTFLAPPYAYWLSRHRKQEG